MKYTLFGKPLGKMVHYEFNIPRSLSHKTDATHVTLGTNQLEYESHHYHPPPCTVPLSWVVMIACHDDQGGLKTTDEVKWLISVHCESLLLWIALMVTPPVL